MGIEVVIVLFILGFIGSFISGMLGIGGAIVNYPILLYLPAILGVANFSAHQVSGMVAVQVLFATITGVWAYRKGGYINKSLIIYMGAGVLAGSLIGSFLSNLFSENQINIIYALLATIAAVMMFLPKKEVSEERFDDTQYNKWLGVLIAFLVGISAGIVGAGGAFILVPVMLVVLKIPTRITIATSLAITFISSIGATAGKLITHQVLLWPTVIIVIASLAASPLGAVVGQKLNSKTLKILLAVLIVLTSLKIWWDVLL
ncbi:sulfite exporter TauE/SafE family protein [Fictibacillus fluitans]|uniref:Probable membrane transporter protein n=1 Tax=Fictibacillus fluitans TaxID=3058422 RepID=A0ABT8HRF7_9BACL|nr:sulfite exporter TauE/SafE family protein [Fictibacillus sp. NE201]MDN4523343.1 sulfite exporter TauE/SafE family protein [Fictibacillus sp. NE201]